MTTSAATGSLKILTVGPAVGSIRDLFAKVKAIDAKHGKFDLCLCVGDFFGPSEGDEVNEDIQALLNGTLEAPLECYVMQGEHPLPTSVVEKFAKTSGDIGKNVFLLSKSAIVTTPHGLRIACLGGEHQPMAYATSESALGFTSPYFSRQTVEKLLANSSSNSSMSSKAKNYTSLSAIASNASTSNLVDILLSTAWPTAITQFATSPPPAIGAAPMDVIVRSTKPRYHFVPGAGEPRSFWEREPYAWDEENGRVARFVGLGAFGGTPVQGKKQRWFYAFTISPLSATSPPAPKAANATPNPFTVAIPGQKRAHDDDHENYIWGGTQPQPGKRVKADGSKNGGAPPDGYQCKVCQSSEHFINDCPQREKPGEDYVCKICGEKGHFVRDCPTKYAVGDTGGRKPKPGYVCRACGSELHYIDDCSVAQATGARGGGGGDRKKRQPPKEIQPDECWFCLSNPNLAKHLIVAVGGECYLTLPKGQLIPTHGPDATAKKGISLVPGGGHLLIVPIAHFPTLASISNDTSSSVMDEVERYKVALKDFFATHDAEPVFMETARVSAKGGHAHIQVIPIPRALSSKMGDAFTTVAAQRGVDFAEDTAGALEACKEGVRGYFRVDLPDGTTMVHMIRERGGFNLQFGREVIAQVLGVEERADWRACAQPDDQDKEDAAAFKTAFGPFDLSM